MKTIHANRLIAPNTTTVIRMHRTTTLKEQHIANDAVGPFLAQAAAAHRTGRISQSLVVRHHDYVALIIRVPNRTRRYVVTSPIPPLSPAA